ncbi:ketopantoate reductase family protein [Tumebacillus algifaecis]|nr:2-dehydropantoate 2-reductase [Tumebacillus algifaecis]
MKIAILGPGAIGRLVGYWLASGGHQVVMVCRRTEQAERLGRQGLTYVDAAGQEHNLQVEAVFEADDEKLAEIDGLIVTVKSYDTEAAAQQIAAWHASIPVLSLQNGLGNAETLARYLAPKRISLALTTHGATAEGDTRVWHKGQGQTVVGDVERGSGAARWWTELLMTCGQSALLSDDIFTEVWRKAMINIGINPFTALLDVRNGQLVQEPEVLRLMQATVQEAEQVARAQGINLQGSFERVLEVCKNTAANSSSMRQDLQKGRRTEIDAMCGVIEEIAEKSGLQAPYNTFLKKMVKKCETKWIILSSLQLQGMFEEFQRN